MEVVLNFLTNCARVHKLRSAIAKQHKANLQLGQLLLVKRLTRACFPENPLIPQYADVWEILLECLNLMHPAETLSNMDLTIKTAYLILIISISRSLSVAAIQTSLE